VKVVVAHPSPAVGSGMATALERDLGVSASSVTTVSDLWECVALDGPDLVLVDVLVDPARMASLCGQLARRRVKPLVLTRADAGVPLYALLESGAVGIVLAGDGLAGVVGAVRTVMAGHTHVPPHLLGAVLHELIVDRRAAPEVTPADRIDNLSPREQEVLALLGHGADTREIATHLVISPHTAKTHINRVLGKLGFSSRTEAAAFAIAHGLRSSLLETTHD
jgi:DNA-binding NarL/FixJ family response regulator